jgi:hypothetical protein
MSCGPGDALYGLFKRRPNGVLPIISKMEELSLDLTGDKEFTQ